MNLWTFLFRCPAILLFRILQYPITRNKTCLHDFIALNVCSVIIVQDDTYTDSYISTIGVDFVSQKLKLENCSITTSLYKLY